MVKTVDLQLEKGDMIFHAPVSRPIADTAPGAVPPSHYANKDANVAIEVDIPAFSGARNRPAGKRKTTSTKNNSHLIVGAFQVNPGVTFDYDVEQTDLTHNHHTLPTVVNGESVLNAEDVGARLEHHNNESIETHQTYVVAEAVNYSKWCGVPKKVWMMVLIFMLAVVGIVAGATHSSRNADSTTSPPSDQTNLFQKLEPSIIRTEADRIPFEDPVSPQSLALEWLSTDSFSLSENRATVEILERYVLVVLYFSTNGPNWRLEGLTFKAEILACDWNNGMNPRIDQARGIFCSEKSTVEHILLDMIGLSGTVPWELSLLGDLVGLAMNNNALRGTLPSELSKLSHLQTFYLAGNSLQGFLPNTLPSSLLYLDYSGNSFNGTIPSEWGDLPDLIMLALLHNQLESSIPSELGKLTALQYLFIYHNVLTGLLPTELGLLNQLVEFDSNNNELTGTIPTEFGQMTRLQNFAIFNNRFTGVLPSELGLLKDLLVLNINGNEFTATIPSELAQLQKLESFTFSHNLLTGSVNFSFCTSSKQWTVLEGDCLANDDGTFEIECSCCTVCVQ